MTKYEQLLVLMFDMTDNIFVNSSFKGTVRSAHITKAFSSLSAWSEAEISSADGVVVGLNSTDEEHCPREANSISTFRNLLIEMDDASLTPEQQIQIIEDSGLPYSAAVFSGSKSVHFIISLDEPVDDLENYKQLHASLVAAINHPAVDYQTSSPAQWTHVPTFNRVKNGKSKQKKLLRIGNRIKAEDIQAFLEKHEDIINEKLAIIRKLNNLKMENNQTFKCHSSIKRYIADHHNATRMSCPACVASKGHDLKKNLYNPGNGFVMCNAGHSLLDIIESISIKYKNNIE